MSALYRLLFLGFLLLGATGLKAQPFFGYQTIGVHTWFVSCTWTGQTPELGVGYGLRRPWGGFADLTAEWRAPMGALFSGRQQRVVVGIYGPLRLRNRRFMGAGLHLHWQRYAAQDGRHSRLSLAGTLLPSYTFAAPLGDQPYLTGGLRATGLLALHDKAQGAATPTWLPAFGTEIGTQVSLHLERSLGLGLNAFATRHWALKESPQPAGTERWQGQGSLYAGSTYFLQRW